MPGKLKFLSILGMFAGMVCHAHANEVTTEFAFSAMVNDFTWEEKLPDGATLEESGLLFGIHLQGNVDLPQAWESFLYGEFYFGTVDYDGFLINLDGSIEPYRSETSYAGMSGAWDFGYDLHPADAWGILPFAGLGTHYWIRALDDEEGYGYDEYWLTMYGRAGLRVHWHQAAGTEFYALGAVLLPFYNYEWAVDVPLAPGNEDVELEPQEEVGFQLEAGMNRGRLHVSVFYEAMEFGQSDLDDSGSFFQPESTRDVAGIRAGIRF